MKKRSYEVMIKVNDDVKLMPVHTYSLLEAAIIIVNRATYERILAVTEVSASRYHALKIAAEISNDDTWLECEEEGMELCRLAGMESEWQEADGDTFESVLNEAAKKLNVKI